MGMLIWLVPLLYSVGVALRTPFSLRNRMLAIYCKRCNKAKRYCDDLSHGYTCVRGADREREGKDVGAAILLASVWPVWIPFLIFRRIMKWSGQVIKDAVLRITPLTAPELERRIGEQRAIITALQEHIGAPPSKVIDLVSPERVVEHLEHFRRNGSYPNSVVEYDAQY